MPGPWAPVPTRGLAPVARRASAPVRPQSFHSNTARAVLPGRTLTWRVCSTPPEVALTR
ncbi:Uncharacterised protein [Bordetella pertussis]|nr:Uncharacterised protein [Bordetella pertussis]